MIIQWGCNLTETPYRPRYRLGIDLKLSDVTETKRKKLQVMKAESKAVGSW